MKCITFVMGLALLAVGAPALGEGAASPPSSAAGAPPAAAGEAEADASAATALAGFSLEDALVPRDEIVLGGPKRDGIRSVDAPEFATPAEATWVAPAVPVLGIDAEAGARAYPVHLLEFHQIVNDVIGDDPVAVTFDPLAGAPRAYRRTLDGKVLSFGVSGLIYRSNFLMYDRETESLWSQFEGRAIAGPLAGKRLERVRVRQETTGAWLSRFPSSKILARPDLKRIDYQYSPFRDYWIADRIPFPVPAEDRRYHAKEVVVGVAVNGKARAYLGSIVTQHGGRVDDEFEGQRIRLRYDPEHSIFSWDVGEGVELSEAYWFAWKAFHPETEIWRDAIAPSPAE